MNQLIELEKQEFIKRDTELCLIPSEGLPSENVLNACSSIFALKYAEGKVGQRFYNGCSEFDKMEDMCQQSVLKLFGAEKDYRACVQPHCGSSANMIVYGALLQPNDTVLSMDVSQGAHISHNHPLSFIGKYHNVISYGLDKDGIIDYRQIEELALKHKPKLIIAGISAYSREVDFKRIKEIADKVGAYTLADIAHITSLVISELHQNPIDYGFDCVTFTTHKMLNGPRGGVILYKNKFEKEISRGVIPFCQGGPLGNMIYAKLVCFTEILNNFDSFKRYALNIKKNAKVMADTFIQNGIKVVSGGTDNHLMLLDLSEWSLSGRDIAKVLEYRGVICNCNAIPNDKKGFFKTSGIRLGTPFVTARGLDEVDCKELAQDISDLLLSLKDGDIVEVYINSLASTVRNIVQRLPLKNIYPKRYKYLFEEEV
jgi:glycine hydroxymethyltransferase